MAPSEGQMNDGQVNPELFRRWGHSFEEDSGSTMVFRPADFDFPRARGRSGVEFRPDGTVIDWAIAAGDGADPRPGRWQIEADGTVTVVTESGQEQQFSLGAGPDGQFELVARQMPSSTIPVVPPTATAAGTPSPTADDFRMPNPGMGGQL